MRNKNVLIILGILAFIAVVGGISFSYFVYNKDLGDVTIDTGEISINYSDVNGNISLSGIIPQNDGAGKISTDYIDFTVDAKVDTEKIYYEVYIIPRNDSTLDKNFLKIYLTDQNDNMLNDVSLYNLLPKSQTGTGKAIYRGLINLNNDYSAREESKDFRLRIWLDENYSEPISKTFSFDVQLYAKNVEENFVIPEHNACIGCVEAGAISIDNIVTQFPDCDNAQCALEKIDELLS